MAKIQSLSPCLWFDSEAEEAARFYVSVFENSRILKILYYTEAGYDIHGKPAGTVLTVEFELSGRRFTALNGGPHFTFSEAVSFELLCETQDAIDYYWVKLGQNGEHGNCGWLKDQYGLSWQVTPIVLGEMLNDPDRSKVERVTNAFLNMKKLQISDLNSAFEGD